MENKIYHNVGKVLNFEPKNVETETKLQTFLGTKRLIRIRKSKERQYNDLQEKNKQRSMKLYTED
jgi:hypothetical protein